MSEPWSIDLTPLEAAGYIERELQVARDSLQSCETDLAQDKFVSTLGLALQLGPAMVDRVLLCVMHEIRKLESSSGSETLATLGPALVHVVSQVRNTGALPSSKAMEAWATVASDLGAIVGQVGLALSIESNRRVGMLANARSRAAALDEATESRFAMTDWIDQIICRT